MSDISQDSNYMVSVNEALRLLLADEPPLPSLLAGVHPGGGVDDALLSRPRLAQAIRARFDLPNADLSVMDGFALRSEDLVGEGWLECLNVGESAAGHPTERRLARGEAIAISTGAVLPPGADYVVAVEDTRPAGEHKIEVNLDALRSRQEGRFVRARGSELKADTLLVDAGGELGPGELALCIGAGHQTFRVFPRPRVAVLATGDELLNPGDTPGPGQVIESNAMMLAMLARESGANVEILPRVGDNPAATRAALARAEEFDLLLTSGGISVGRHDLVLPSLEALGFETSFRKVRLRPGKPTTYFTKTLPTQPARTARVLALPGNPASSFVAFELLARPLIRRLGGHPDDGRARCKVSLGCRIQPEKSRTHFVRARVRDGQAWPLETQLSGALASIVNAELLLVIEAGNEALEAGVQVQALDLRSISGTR